MKNKRNYTLMQLTIFSFNVRKMKSFVLQDRWKRGRASCICIDRINILMEVRYLLMERIGPKKIIRFIEIPMV